MPYNMPKPQLVPQQPQIKPKTPKVSQQPPQMGVQTPQQVPQVGSQSGGGGPVSTRSHKYTKREALPGGGFRYFYPEDPSHGSHQEYTVDDNLAIEADHQPGVFNDPKTYERYKALENKARIYFEHARNTPVSNPARGAWYQHARHFQDAARQASSDYYGSSNQRSPIPSNVTGDQMKVNAMPGTNKGQRLTELDAQIAEERKRGITWSQAVADRDSLLGYTND